MRGDIDQLRDDILLAKLCNMNFLRLTQRPVQDEIYKWCDRLGLMTQTDLPRGQKSGLAAAVKILSGIGDIGIHYFTERDVVRHRLVQRIITAYEKYEKERAAKQNESKSYRFNKK